MKQKDARVVFGIKAFKWHKVHFTETALKMDNSL